MYTHERLVRARNSLNRLIGQGLLFTYLDPTWQHLMPATANQIESSNARLRQILRGHRGMRLITRRMKAVYWWWCYTHSEHPQPVATILTTMPRLLPRKCLVSSHANPPSHRHHPRLGRRNLLERTPPHHPLPQHLELTPDQQVLSDNPLAPSERNAVASMYSYNCVTGRCNRRFCETLSVTCPSCL